MSTSQFDPIAIVSLAGRFPGANSPEELWQRIIKKSPAVQTVPKDRWIADPCIFLDANSGTPVSDKVYSDKMCLLPPSATSCEGLPIPKEEAEKLDPLYRLVLRVGCEAWSRCKSESILPDRVSVVLASIALPTDSSSALTRSRIGNRLEKQILGDTPPSFLMNSTVDDQNNHVVGYPAIFLRDTLGFSGLAYTLDAACASSLYALRHACDMLHENRADAVLAGGASRPDSLYTQMGFCQLKALSPTGVCSPFDERANGLVVGEGCAIAVLKRLDDALRDGDSIQGVIRSVGLSCDIDGSLLSPASEGQLRAMRQAYDLAGLPLDTLDYIECHGTGTPVGDAEEINTYSILWNEMVSENSPKARKCVLGSVKATIGHMLTAAGMGGLASVLQAMHNQKLPPISTFQTPAIRCQFDNAPVRVLTQAEPWTRQDQNIPRRAGISAFGFGGINAHLIIEEFDPSIHTLDLQSRSNDNLSPDIAIVGMALHIGKSSSCEEAQAALLSGQMTAISGAISKITIPHGRYRIPPKELEEILPQQLLMLETTREALVSSKLSLRERRPRAAVFIGQSLDPNTNNYHLRWTAHALRNEWEQKLGYELTNFESICNSISPPLNSVRVLGSLGNIIANRIAKELQFGGGSFTVSAEEESGTVALDLAIRALQRGEIDMAVAGCVDLPCDERLVTHNVHKPTDAAAAFILKRVDDAKRDGDNILAIVEGNGSFDSACDYVEFSRKSPPHPITGKPLCSIGCIDELWCGATTELLGFAKVVTAINTQILPATTHDLHLQFINTSTYSLKVPHYWYRNRSNGARNAQMRGTHFCWHLTSSENHAPPPANPLRNSTTVFAVSGNSTVDLVTQLGKLLAEQIKGRHLSQFACDWNKLNPLKQDHCLAVGIMASTIKGLHQAIGHAIDSVKSGGPCTGQHGVYYSPKPSCSPDNICFVFPGSGNHYPGMGLEISANWPGVIDQIDRRCNRLKDQIRPDLITPYQPSLQNELKANAIALLTSHVAHATLMTELLQSIGINPRFALSYSLGESSCYFALNVWHQKDEMLERMERSSLFTRDLYGSFDAVKVTWNMPQDSKINWSVALLAVDAEIVKPILEQFQHVYLLLQNAPNECVLGGLHEEIIEIGNFAKATPLFIEGVTVAHCEVVEHVREAYWNLHYFQDTVSPENIHFYSSALCREITLTPQMCADSITAHAIHGFDFSKIVQKVFNDGARAFVEVGPGSSCTRMIAKILSDKQPYCAVSACRPGENGVDTIMSLAATLISERALNNLQPLLSSMSVCQQDAILSGTPVTALSIHNPMKFQGIKAAHEKKPEHLQQGILQSSKYPQKKLTHPPETPSSVNSSSKDQLIYDMILEIATIQNQLHLQFMELSATSAQLMAQAAQDQTTQIQDFSPQYNPIALQNSRHPSDAGAQFNYDACMEFAIGKIANVLGPDFAEVDTHQTRVRLPDSPLMLCHRIMFVEGHPKSLGQGRCVTEHDVAHDAWYLDGGIAPVCISVEAGQADLFLCAYLGIDFETKGKRVYRLLDATIHFHRGLPWPGETIRYDIHIDRFVRQGDTWLFFFWYDGTINGQPFLTMRNGCAGFFTHEEVENSGGLILNPPTPALNTELNWHLPIPVTKDEHYTEAQIDSLRAGNLKECFGQEFSNVPYNGTPFLPSGIMRLVHRVVNLQIRGGRYHNGFIRAEADIHPDDWFLTCHFVDDMVMPGTLMYECCAHTLRIFLLRIGWIGNPSKICYEPVALQPAKLRCRGPVLQSTKIVTYEIHILNLGFNPAPYAVCEAIMYADGRPIVHFDNMTMQISNTNHDELSIMWQNAKLGNASSKTSEISLIGNTPLPISKTIQNILFDRKSILAYAEGNPSEGFGEPYKIFDPGNPQQRILARLPRPPYLLMDRVTKIHDGSQWNVEAGIWIESQFDFSPDDWYFRSNNHTMPFCIILEIALQPCGWICAFLGCALKSETDLKFRNLGGSATLYREITEADAPNTLTMRTKLTKFNEAGGMMILNFATQVWLEEDIIYDCITEFGFFTATALASQVGIREAKKRRFQADLSAEPILLPRYAPTTPWEDKVRREPAFELPSKALLMIDRIDRCDISGPPNGFGYVHGTKIIDPDEWLFYAHFYQDPVCPGSLGLESFLQLLKYYMIQAFPKLAKTHRFEPIAVGMQQQWIYRGQIITTNKQVEVDASITEITESADGSVTVKADGFLSADSLIIYEMKQFTMRAVPKDR